MAIDHDTSTLSSGSVVHNWSVPNPRAIIVLQHGFSEHAERYVQSFNRLIPRLNENGYEIWAMDLWGHGRSPGGRSLVDIENAVSDHIELRKHVADLKPGLPIYLLGHSIGGLVTAGSMCKEKTSPVEGVILTGPALLAEAPLLTRFIVSPIASIMPSLPAEFGPAKMEGMCQPEEIAKFLNDPMTYKGHVSFLLAATALRTSEYIWPKLAEWTVPTMVMHGMKDTYTDHKQSERFVNLISSKDKTLHLIENGLHDALNDVNAECHFQTILGWLDRHVDAAR